MLFGMPTLIETNTLEGCAVLCKDFNLDFIELNMNLHSINCKTLMSRTSMMLQTSMGYSTQFIWMRISTSVILILILQMDTDAQ